MSDLRTRIAVALKTQAEFRGIYKIADFDFPFLADAVIAELGLEIDLGNTYDIGGEATSYRYISKWWVK
jgi:hypothetical protein